MYLRMDNVTVLRDDSNAVLAHNEKGGWEVGGGGVEVASAGVTIGSDRVM